MKDIFAGEKPLDLEQYFIRINNIVSKNPDRNSIQIMERIRQQISDQKSQKEVEGKKTPKATSSVTVKEDTTNKK